MDSLQFIYPLTCWWTLGFFPVFNYYQKKALCEHMLLFIWVNTLYGRCMINFLKLLSKMVIPFYIPTSVCESSSRFTSLSTLGLVGLFILIIQVSVWWYLIGI